MSPHLLLDLPQAQTAYWSPCPRSRGGRMLSLANKLTSDNSNKKEGKRGSFITRHSHRKAEIDERK